MSAKTLDDGIGDDALSARLRAFVAEAPLIRAPHITLLRAFAARLPADANVLDVGAGEAPYRELFSHTTYLTSDWDGSIYPEAAQADIHAPAHAMPVADGTFDALVNTQVLEHVPDPAGALREFYRILKPGGSLVLSTPFVWYLHELPHDYYRYTNYGLRHLLEGAGFEEIEIKPMNNSFETVAQVAHHLGYMAGRADDGFDLQRDLIDRAMAAVGDLVSSFGGLDTQWIFPLSFSATATRGNGSIHVEAPASDLAIARAENSRLLAVLAANRSQLVALRSGEASGAQNVG